MTLKLDTPVSAADISVEEDDRDLSRYKKVHAHGCSGLRDFDRISFDGGTVADLMDELTGYAVCDGPVESELPYFSDMLLPCARKVLGLTGVKA